jgi:hypothetical protein
MTNLLNIFTPSSTNIFFVSGVAGIAGLTLGFIIKSASIARHKKKGYKSRRRNAFEPFAHFGSGKAGCTT